MKTVLLTGATGCIGNKTIRFLIERNYVVHAITSKKSLAENSENLFWHQADLLDIKRTQELTEQVKASHLLHLAWYFQSDVYSSTINFEWVNASLILLESFKKNGGQRAVCAGTCAEYSWTEKIYSENETLLKPQSIYGKCKLAWQILFEAFAERAEISAAWGRVFFLYGANENPNRLVPSVIQSLLRGKTALCSHGNQIRDYLYVEDVAEAFVNILESDVSGAVNIASGVPISLKEIIFKIAEIIGRQDLIKLGAIATSPNEPPQIVADVKKLKYEVNWNPKWSLDQGLTETIGWWRKHT